jgi:hypothetical protein
VTVQVLDLFCGAGGVTKGWQLAGCHVTGVDIEPQPNYCGDAFVQADALRYVVQHGRRFDVIVASPVCKKFTSLRNMSQKTRRYADSLVNLIPPTRERLSSIGVPYVIENVPGAPLVDPILLCGSMFGLGVIRHRLFESNLPLVPLPHRRCFSVRDHPHYSAVFGAQTPDGGYDHDGYERRGSRKTADWKIAMGIDWMTRYELTQAIPPAYSLFIARQALWLMGARPLEVAVTFQPSLFAAMETA